jgi:hypothetical protein
VTAFLGLMNKSNGVTNRQEKMSIRFGRLLGATTEDTAISLAQTSLEGVNELKGRMDSALSARVVASDELSHFETAALSCLKWRIELQGAVFVYGIINRLSGEVTKLDSILECGWMKNTQAFSSGGRTKSVADITSNDKQVIVKQYAKEKLVMVPKQTYGDFFSVVNSRKTNPLSGLSSDAGISTADVFVGGAAGETFESMALSSLKGRSVVVFAYGYSGTGKTTCIFGRGLEDEGSIKRSIRSIQKQNVSNKVIMSRVFELYGTMDLTSAYKTLQSQKKILKTATSSRVFNYSIGKLEFEIDNLHLLDEKVSQLNKERLKGSNNKLDPRLERRIKCTPNNPSSSRGNLFLVFEVQISETKKRGYLMFCDMSGIENPIAIARSIAINPTLDQTVQRNKLSTYLHGEHTPRLPVLDELKNEGFFINET